MLLLFKVLTKILHSADSSNKVVPLRVDNACQTPHRKYWLTTLNITTVLLEVWQPALVASCWKVTCFSARQIPFCGILLGAACVETWQLHLPRFCTNKVKSGVSICSITSDNHKGLPHFSETRGQSGTVSTCQPSCTSHQHIQLAGFPDARRQLHLVPSSIK